jgi:two-component system, sensor histidine kinase and response regulator
LTSMGQRGDAGRLEALGCSAYLLKPVKQQMLFNAIVAVLSREEESSAGLITRHTLSENRKLGFRILLAEDNAINQKLALVLLQKAGYSVDAVETGVQAIKKIQSNQYSVVLMDVQMSEMDGLEATQRIRELEKLTGMHVPIIAMTAHAMQGDRELCLDAGMDDYVTKPLQPKVLFSAIDRWIKFATLSKEDIRFTQDYSSQESAFSMEMDDGLFGEDIPSPLTQEPGVIIPVIQEIATSDAVPVDFDSALCHFDDNRDFMLELFKQYKDQLPERMVEIQEAVREGDANRLTRLAHNLKGLSLNFSANTLAQFALGLEEIGRQNDLTQAAVIFRQLEAETQRVKEYLIQNGL